jgi:hypothetical protein
VEYAGDGYTLKAKDNLSGWELIFPAVVQKVPAVQIHSGDED